MNFFERLGLELSADPRAVRRAYARELKRIDQEKDLEAFQALREAYEGALRWIEDGMCKPPELKPVGQLMHQESFARLQNLESLDQARQALLELRPLNLEASEAFEKAVAALLDVGWRPGHEYLFPAACELFYWEGRNPPPYLENLDALAGAIEDLKYLRMQPEQVRLNHVRVIENLRRKELPGMADLARDIIFTEIVITVYPDLMELACAPGRVVAWRTKLAEAKSEAERRQQKENATSSHPLARLTWFLCLIAIPLGVTLGLLNFKFARKVETRQLTVMETNWITRNVEPIVVDGAVEFEVHLTEHGDISELQLIGKAAGRTSHVERAIRLARPYPDEYPRSFRVRFPIL